ncbi:MAG TPA: hypothetical protein ENJ09_06715 [Planctomycetes bacterium]|nr:hypothetical protein [Planctomycetota bacterium]
MNDLERRLGAYPETSHAAQAKGRGTLLLVVGGMHGNEPAGVLAARRVLETLGELRPDVHGRIVCLAGNVGALREGLRYRSRDLNRLWEPQAIERARAARDIESEDEEAREQRELLWEIEEHLAGSWERVALLDLHSTSAVGAPFSIMGDTLQNRGVAFALGVPVILGLEERIDGTLLSYFSERGHTAVCVEGGQNDLPETVEHHEAAIWISLHSLGMIAEADVPALEEKRGLLATAARGLPKVIEIRHRQDVPDEIDFAMRPGFANFHRIHDGELLGWFCEPGEEDVAPGQRKEVRTPLDGLLLMPRYQGQGNDAFFVGREVRRTWLAVSAVLRRLRLQWILPLLPGVRAVEGRTRRLRVDGHIARWDVLEILHLFGYRRCSAEGEQLEFVRRADRL